MLDQVVESWRSLSDRMFSSLRGDAERSVLISCHIGKTGGTSVRQMLNSVHGADRLAFLIRPPASGPIPRGAYSLLPLHYSHALSIDSHDLRYVPPSEFWPGAKFLTVLRDPVETFFSGYYFVRYHIGRRLGEEISDEDRERWLNENYPSPRGMSMIFANNQTRFLAWKSFFENADMQDAEVAKTELEKYDMIVLNDRLDEAPDLIANHFPEFKGAKILRENVTPGRAANSTWAERVDPADLKWAQDLLRPDIALYEKAVNIYLRRQVS